MSFLESFSDFNALRELNFSESVKPDGLLVSQDGLDYTVVKNPFGPDFAVDPALCVAYPCYAERVGEAQFSPIKIRGESESTIGYLFPLASLVSGSAIVNDWARRYAWVAVNALLTHTGSFLLGAARPQIKSLRDGETGLDEIFPDRLGVAVVSRQAFNQVNISFDYARMLLMAGGIRFPRQFHTVTPRDFSDEPNESLTCPRPAKTFKHDDVSELLVEMADSTDSDIGTFITLYQNIEITLSRLFTTAISFAPSDDLSAWEMKERLQSISKETWRLSVLDRLCLSSIDRSLTARLAEECQEFLSKAGRPIKPGHTWWKLLYLVRNTIVHEQPTVIRDNYWNLASINVTLRTVCLNILLNYEDPEVEALWLTAE